MNTEIKFSRGFSMIEAVISMAIALGLIYAISNLNAQSAVLSVENMTSLKAQLYTSEAIEAMKDISFSATRWNSYVASSPCSSSAPCHPVLSANVWSISNGSEILNGIFTRSVWFEPVLRNACVTAPGAFPDPVVYSGGCFDPNTMKTVVTTTWTDNLGAHTQKLEAYIYHP